MSDVPDFLDPIDDAAVEVEQTVDAGMSQTAVEQPKKRGLFSIELFDMLLLVAFILITLASMLMIYELAKFGSVFSAPWNVG